MKHDPEIATIGKIWRLLQPFDADARARILHYIVDKHECTAPDGTAAVIFRESTGDELADAAMAALPRQDYAELLLQPMKPSEGLGGFDPADDDLAIPPQLQRGGK